VFFTFIINSISTLYDWPLAWQFAGSSSLLSKQSLYPLHSQYSLIHRPFPPGHGISGRRQPVLATIQRTIAIKCLSLRTNSLFHLHYLPHYAEKFVNYNFNFSRLQMHVRFLCIAFKFFTFFTSVLNDSTVYWARVLWWQWVIFSLPRRRHERWVLSTGGIRPEGKVSYNTTTLDQLFYRLEIRLQKKWY